MTLYPPLPSRNPSFPSGRYLKTDPLRREFGLKLLTEPLPEPLRTTLIRAWRRPVRYDGKQAIQSLHRQRPDEASLPIISVAAAGLDRADRIGSVAARRGNTAEPASAARRATSC